MRGKILLLVGFGVGYVLGTRDGRERYEQIKAQAKKMWTDPRVQKAADQAGDFVKDKGGDVAEFLADGAKTVVAAAAGKKPPASKPASKPASSASKSSSTSK